MPDLDYFFTRLAEQAKSGDRDDAISLLREFVQMHANGEHIPAPLVAYIAECIETWLDSECNPEEATRAFNVQRPAHQDKSGEISRKVTLKHIKALRTYYLMRGRRKGRERAIEIAAKNTGLGE